MGFDLAGFTVGFSAVLTAFFFAWVVGLSARIIEWGGE